MKKRFSGEQTIGPLKQADAGVPVKELARRCRHWGRVNLPHLVWRTLEDQILSSIEMLSARKASATYNWKPPGGE